MYLINRVLQQLSMAHTQIEADSTSIKHYMGGPEELSDAYVVSCSRDCGWDKALLRVLLRSHI